MVVVWDLGRESRMQGVRKGRVKRNNKESWKGILGFLASIKLAGVIRCMVSLSLSLLLFFIFFFFSHTL